MTDDEKRELIAEARRTLFEDSEIGYEDTKEGDLIYRLADALEGTLTEPEWRGVVLGRENATDVDANWQLAVWDPTEIETARREFPKSEYKLARMILDESEVPDV